MWRCGNGGGGGHPWGLWWLRWWAPLGGFGGCVGAKRPVAMVVAPVLSAVFVSSGAGCRCYGGGCGPRSAMAVVTVCHQWQPHSLLRPPPLPPVRAHHLQPPIT